MLDALGRRIDYLRISVTDRCDLRCVYCMPAEGVAPMCHTDILRYEDILRLARLFAGLGIKKIRLTGGEPLVRLHIERLAAGLKAIPGIERLGITTNGTQLAQKLPALLDAGLDLLNISLDTVDEALFQRITRRSGVAQVLRGVEAALAAPGLTVKVNCVPTDLNREGLLPLVAYFRDKNVSLRFIELMPIGLGAQLQGLAEAEVRALLEGAYGPMEPLPGDEVGGPCRYFSLPGFAGRIGFISAMSHKFCASCNRIRLTANGFLKTCLQYERGVSLRALLDEPDEVLIAAIQAAIADKPVGHHFTQPAAAWDERHVMAQIGG